MFLIAPEAVALAYAREDGAEPVVGRAADGQPPGRRGDRCLAGRAGWDPLRQVRLIVPLAVCGCLPLMLTSLAPPWQSRCRCGSSPASRRASWSR